MFGCPVGSYRPRYGCQFRPARDSSVDGNLGVSPIAGTAITGFGLVLDSTGTFSTSLGTSKVTNTVYACLSGRRTRRHGGACTDATGRVGPDDTEHGSGNLNDLTLPSAFFPFFSFGSSSFLDLYPVGRQLATWYIALQNRYNLFTRNGQDAFIQILGIQGYYHTYSRSSRGF
jgi:hypothetical protein